ncbi:conjugative transfer system coupling protein TraD [Undibacterium sp. Jales W-56]|uniref:conjugative transfer system coupling protein TraD n=1 Tax=Undibacterium sp. Jales W-56 TaxID=2897325 RepID=UPI0021D0D378|nr:conjugative transfer system coupling protein TraD [Undibacterium sp. Jales W-56]MCU6435328.1 conjugative transfer system coupling protein TraD [Undibacterium sp. Jales W-56]
MLIRKYEMPWRRAYEAYAALAWFISLVFFVTISVRAELPSQFTGPLAIACMWMTIRRMHQALRILVVRASLSGRAMQVLTTKELKTLCRQPDQVFLGFGFEWLPVHSQRLYELSKVNFRDYSVSPVLLHCLGYEANPQPDSEIGLPYIHGVESREHALYRPLQNFEGGTLLVGTTQSGKGVALANLVTQAVRRGDVVVVIDPKNSRRLKRAVMRACADYRDADTFLEFHPAFPENGVRLDFTFNWQKPTEIASRIQSVMPPDTAGAFSAFGWDAVNVVVQGLVDLEERPNLMKLTKYIEGGIEPVLEASLRRFFNGVYGSTWRDQPEMRKLLGDAQRGNLKRPSEAASNDLLAFVAFYEHHVPQNQHNKVVDSQVRTFRHNREHYQKITANLLPILSMLTSGDLGLSLSPDPFDAVDVRPIMNFEKIERGGHVLYMCLDSLPDPSVASAIGALSLADLAARAGMRYNLGGYRRISLFVDEVSNVINQPLIEILNKGAEGGIFTTCAMQTLADLAKRLGSEDAARMALGNLNNLIALRSKDRPTQDFIVETFGKTAIHTVRVGLSEASDAHLGDFTSVSSAQLSESMEELIPADILGKLPNLQYFASVSGGRIIKGRFPILNPDFDRPT